MASKQEIITEIENHIASRGGSYYSWYIGVTDNAKRRVYDEHGVDPDKDKFIWRTVSSYSVARDIEKYFLDLGCDGGPGGGGETSNVVYAYKKSSRTDP